MNKLELEYELELKIQHAARGTADIHIQALRAFRRTNLRSIG